MGTRKQSFAGGGIWSADTFAELIAIGAQARLGDRAFLVSAGIELARMSVGGVGRWVPLDPTWGGNSLAAVPFGFISTEGVWTIDAATHNMTNAGVNVRYDCLGIVLEATAANIALVFSGVTQVPAFVEFRCVNLTRQNTANTAFMYFIGGGFAGGAANATGGGPSATAYHGQFTCCAGGGGGGGSSTGSGGNGSATGEYWKTGKLAVAAGGTSGLPGVGGASAASVPTSPFERTSLGGHCIVGGGGGGGGTGGGAGGAGGCALIVHAAEVVSNATGIQFQAGGANGANAVAANSGGGGGGSGGYLRHLYRVKTGVVVCSVAAGSGGAGNGGGAAGGAGGAGLIVNTQV